METKNNLVLLQKLKIEKPQKNSKGIFKCFCGREFVAYINNVKRNLTKSCGCTASKILSERSKTHGLSKTRFYKIYSKLVHRCKCNKTTCAGYKNYFSKGVRNEWKSFEEFTQDMYESYLVHSKNHTEKQTTLDRIDSKGNYSKENCRWATYKEQARNTKVNRYVIHEGKRRLIIELCEVYKIKHATLLKRIELGWSIEKALKTPIRRKILGE